MGVDFILSRASAKAAQDRKWQDFQGKLTRATVGSSGRAQDENQTLS
jgi:hypothetical protein